MKVSEVFHSVQGEGSLAGVASTFIRLALCNLTCSWCDAAYTWKGDVKFEERELADVLAEVKHKHVVLTGGEPTYADEFDSLVGGLWGEGHHVTVETNGTIWRANSVGLVDLWSVSPKLGSSGQGPMLNEEVLRQYIELAPASVQWKFVIDNGSDFEAALMLMRRLGMGDGRDHQVFMQPNGLCHVAVAQFEPLEANPNGGERVTDTTPQDARLFDVNEAGTVELALPYLDRIRWLYGEVVKADADDALPCRVRVVPQLHKLAWGNRRGF